MTGYQSEAQLEESLIKRLEGLGYARVTLRGSSDLDVNLRRQLDKFNADVLGGKPLSESEFARVLHHLAPGTVFEKAQRLRERMQLPRDDGSTVYLRFLNTEHWCRNEYQVTNQIPVEGAYRNRYDVTLLINGLPLAQIELKRRGMELKEAFNQVNRYQRHSYWADNALFQYVQIFVISNGVNTKYYANNRRQDFKQTFYWANEANELITSLDHFADAFLGKCRLSKMICKYVVLHQSDKVLMVLRPYQHYAAEAILKRVKDGRRNGYIWHTTGSGKTLTSFKTAQLLNETSEVNRVIFVVDRADLDDQTTKEFNAFSEGSVDGTDNTRELVRQLEGDTKLIVTTIQKLNAAISGERYGSRLEEVRRQRVVFIFDECHRSQFGKVHKRIGGFFTDAQMFGFTGTPIFAENAVAGEFGKRTTADLFEECLHKYVITNAIADENVLRFSIEYWGKLRRRDGSLIDEEVAGINTKEFFENPERIEQIVDWVVANHDRKTHRRHFSAILCVGSVDALLTFYDLFKAKKEAGKHDLRVATIFTYAANEEDPDATGQIDEPDYNAEMTGPVLTHSRDRLAQCVGDYNAMFGENQSVRDGQAFYSYFRNLSKRMKGRDKQDLDKDRIDILLVVNMFLTGFDVKRLNTIYVDKNLRYHGLVQAYSRTNRTLGQLKSHGNVVCFRNLQPKTDEAIRLFSDQNPRETILLEPYAYYRERFNLEVAALREIAPEPASVDGLILEDDQLRFVCVFRSLMRLRNVLTGFSEYDPAALDLTPQEFEDYKSKYLDIYDRTRQPKPDAGASIIEEVDFELELIRRDEVSVAYILRLLQDEIDEAVQGQAAASAASPPHKAILDLIASEPQLRSKRDLIEKFIRDCMPGISSSVSVEQEFRTYWSAERAAALSALCREERLDPSSLNRLIDAYQFSGRRPLAHAVSDAMTIQPRILERRELLTRVTQRIVSVVETFDEGIGVLG